MPLILLGRREDIAVGSLQRNDWFKKVNNKKALQPNIESANQAEPFDFFLKHKEQSPEVAKHRA